MKERKRRSFCFFSERISSLKRNTEAFFVKRERDDHSSAVFLSFKIVTISNDGDERFLHFLTKQTKKDKNFDYNFVIMKS